MHICVLASGSSGNAIYVSDGHTALLVDAGLSGVEIERRMHRRNLDPRTLNGIIVSHEHEDHLRGVGILSRRYALPVFITSGTHLAATRLGRLHRVCNFTCGTGFTINSLTIQPFSLSHDAADPAGFTIRSGAFKIGIATDLGIATAMVQHRLQGCQALVLEANHDPQMLLAGPYPWATKQRVKGRQGHLSNQEARELLTAVHNAQLQHVILAHLSAHNNTVDKALAEVGMALRDSRAQLLAAGHADSTAMITLKGDF